MHPHTSERGKNIPGACYLRIPDHYTSLQHNTVCRVVLQKRSIRRFVITEKAPSRAFSWLKAATTAFTFKTLLRHYAKWALTPQSIIMKLGSRRNYHKGRAAIRHYVNQPILCHGSNFTLRDRGVNARLA